MHGSSRRLIIAACATLLTTVACGPPRPKVIEFGWDIPSPAELRANVERMERAPFDGVVLEAKLGDGSALSWQIWGRRRITRADLAGSLADLRATRFNRFTDNFLRVNVMPGDVDWFDPAWDGIAANFGEAARLAHDAGLVGLMFDSEQYNTQPLPFSYAARPKRPLRTPTEYAEQARLRGRQWIRAINEHFPDVTLLVVFGHSIPDLQAHYAGAPRASGPVSDEVLGRVSYGLLAPFLDGVLEAAHPQTRFHDVFEPSYPYKQRVQFEHARRQIHEAGRVSRVPEVLRRRLHAGFGLWLDYESGQLGWHTDDLSRNFFSPEHFERSLGDALDLTDGYVWVYCERMNWWTGRDVPEAYREAIERARAGVRRR